MSFHFDYTSIPPLPLNSGEDMGVIDHPEGPANYGTTEPNVGHLGSFDMQCDYARASTWSLFSSITFLSAVFAAV